ncbi:YbaN family protein [Pseudogemmobacter faecipullorum]|nr:YbaN family protein [Pseudogemmobacter faecipullorum]
MVARGFIGAFLPLMSTTIFLILATGCFAQSGIWNAITR